MQLVVGVCGIDFYFWLEFGFVLNVLFRHEFFQFGFTDDRFLWKESKKQFRTVYYNANTSE